MRSDPKHILPQDAKQFRHLYRRIAGKRSIKLDGRALVAWRGPVGILSTQQTERRLGPASRRIDHDKANPAQRLRDELRRASIAGAVDPSARSYQRISPAALLDRSGEDAGARAVRRTV